ncbi:unnamed protein product [Allacma fusca]|uniref:SEC14-like protein 2 n=1 Tax=Allacma fusca TaxID=39272 RepID=A0A8J2PKB1_9HEXA|nr:unnamed protein product [Allacma fusca]
MQVLFCCFCQDSEDVQSRPDSMNELCWSDRHSQPLTLSHSAPNMITPEESRLLPEFKSLLQDLNFDWYDGHDLSLLKWLRARDLDMDKAEKMLRKSSDWRKKNQIESILSYEFPTDMTKEFPFQISGIDSEGCFIVVVPFGQWDFRKFSESGKKHLVLTYVDYLLELLVTVLKKRSCPASVILQAVIILDYDGFSLRQITSKQNVEMLIQILSQIESNRPEMLKRAYIINAPRVFEMAYKLFKPLISARTLSKAYIYGPNASEWKSGLLSTIPHGSLPSYYGGSNSSCSNYKFEDKANVGNITHKQFPEDEMTSAVVEAREIYQVTVEAYQSDLIRWSFRTEKNDIGFQLLNPCRENLIDCPRVDSHKFKQNGTIQCPSSGTYTLCFDNSYSRFASKNLWYAVSVSDLDG